MGVNFLGAGFMAPGHMGKGVDILSISGDHDLTRTIGDSRLDIPESRLRRLDFISKLLIGATKLCLDDADFSAWNVDLSRFGAVVGTAHGSIDVLLDFDASIYDGNISAIKFPNTVVSQSTGHICMEFGFQGPSATFCSGGVSGFQAAMYAATLIQEGHADVMLVGGADVLIQTVEQLEGVIPSEMLPLSEGGVALILASDEFVVENNCTSYARLTSSGQTFSTGGNKESSIVGWWDSVLGRVGTEGSYDYVATSFTSRKRLAAMLKRSPATFHCLDERLGNMRAGSALLSLVDAALSVRRASVMGFPLRGTSAYCDVTGYNAFVTFDDPS